VMPKSIEDPNHLNNQCQNHPVVTAEDTDVDDDTVVNWLDNCPKIPNSDQADNDDDDIGDVCDDDDDNDDILDDADECDFAAEDFDEIDDDDGCPETDLDIDVDKDDEPIQVDVSETERFTVTTTATNEDPPEGYGLYYPDGVRFIELLKSDITNPDDKCEARWVCLAGDGCIEDVITASTEMTAERFATAGQIDVDDPTGFSVGDTIKIDTDGDAEFTKITAISGDNLSISPALGSYHPAGTPVSHSSLYSQLEVV
ncbi:unnamed protein product, partial [marine sediment metagenome]